MTFVVSILCSTGGTRTRDHHGDSVAFYQLNYDTILCLRWNRTTITSNNLLCSFYSSYYNTIVKGPDLRLRLCRQYTQLNRHFIAVWVGIEPTVEFLLTGLTARTVRPLRQPHNMSSILMLSPATL